jgi:hypothetical protein
LVFACLLVGLQACQHFIGDMTDIGLGYFTVSPKKQWTFSPYRML